MQLHYIPLLANLFVLVSSDQSSHEETCATSHELEEKCAAVCYPTVKPLLRYMEICEKKSKLVTQLQEKLNEQDIEITKCNEKVTVQGESLTNGESICKLNNVLKDSFKEVEHLNSQLNEEIAKIHFVKNEESSRKYKELQKEYNDYQDKSEELYVQFRVKNEIQAQRNEALQSQLNELKEASSRLNLTLSKTEELRASLTQQKIDLIKQVEKLNINIGNLRSDLKSSKIINDNLTHQHNVVNSRLHKMEGECRRKDSALYEHKAHISRLEKQNKEMSSKLDSYERYCPHCSLISDHAKRTEEHLANTFRFLKHP